MHPQTLNTVTRIEHVLLLNPNLSPREHALIVALATLARRGDYRVVIDPRSTLLQMEPRSC